MAERVWDKYLTEQDKAHIALSKDQRWGFGEYPALLLVDVYRGVFGDKPEPLLEATKRWPSSCGMAGWDALPHIQTLLATAREVEIPIVHVTGFDTIPHHSAFRKSKRHSANMSPEEQERARERFEIMPEVAPLPGEGLIHKSSPSAFWGTPLAGHLRYMGVDTVIVCGESTSGCVRASVVDGRTNRFRMTVVEECVFDRHEAPHAMNLFDMHKKYADVLPLGEVLEVLKSWRAEQDRQGG
jgi:nicotinamidase-related amidase